MIKLTKNKLLYGFGFNEMFEVMKDPNAPGRLGRDGLNEKRTQSYFYVNWKNGFIGLIFLFSFPTKANCSDEE